MLLLESYLYYCIFCEIILHNKLPQNSVALKNKHLLGSCICGLEVGGDQLGTSSARLLSLSGG